MTDVMYKLCCDSSLSLCQTTTWHRHNVMTDVMYTLCYDTSLSLCQNATWHKHNVMSNVKNTTAAHHMTNNGAVGGCRSGRIDNARVCVCVCVCVCVSVSVCVCV